MHGLLRLNVAIGKDSFAGLSYCKATKVSKTIHNIQSLVPSMQPGFNQMLLTMTVSKTGSQIVVNNLKLLGQSLSPTKTMFIQDKWAGETERLKSIIPYVFDNIDWKNKTLKE